MRKNNSQHDYGIVSDIPQDGDVLYWLDYDTDQGILKLNGIRIQRFQWGKQADMLFTELFSQADDIKVLEIQDGSVDFNPIVNNIKMPLLFRKAIFRTSDSGNKMQITTRINREMLKKHRVLQSTVDDYITEKRDALYKSEKTNKVQ
ncbi:MAG: hypothetical protein JWN28_379 [Candidatus Saccharibacteria bacterium]|nr:hypothetical protein [Candidatus Saccharibacteria bacterium]